MRYSKLGNRILCEDSTLADLTKQAFDAILLIVPPKPDVGTDDLLGGRPPAERRAILSFNRNTLVEKVRRVVGDAQALKGMEEVHKRLLREARERRREEKG